MPPLPDHVIVSSDLNDLRRLEEDGINLVIIKDVFSAATHAYLDRLHVSDLHREVVGLDQTQYNIYRQVHIHWFNNFCAQEISIADLFAQTSSVRLPENDGFKEWLKDVQRITTAFDTLILNNIPTTGGFAINRPRENAFWHPDRTVPVRGIFNMAGATTAWIPNQLVYTSDSSRPNLLSGRDVFDGHFETDRQFFPARSFGAWKGSRYPFALIHSDPTQSISSATRFLGMLDKNIRKKAALTAQ